MSSRRFLLLLVHSIALSVLFAIPSSGQTLAVDELGINPCSVLEGGNIDSVSMQQGNVTLHIPIYSLPQRGRLGLSFSLVGNNHGYSLNRILAGSTLIYQYTRFSPFQPTPIGPVPMMDQNLTLRGDSFSYFVNGNPNSPVSNHVLWSLLDATGGRHSLGLDANNLSNLRSTDGTGF